MISRKLRCLRRARNWAILFFVLTLVASVCILGVSFLDAQQSAKISNFIKSIFTTVKPDADIDHGNCSALKVNSTYGYIGNTTTVKVAPIPTKSTLLPYQIQVEDPSVAVVEDGKLTLVGKGDTNIVVFLVDNPKISAKGFVRCYGFDPQQVVDVNVDNIFGENNIIEARSVVYPQMTVSVDGVKYTKANWNYETKVTVTDLDGNPTDIAKCNEQRLVAYKAGQVLVTISYGKDYSLCKQVVVNIVDTGANPMPTQVVLSGESLQVYQSWEYHAGGFIKKVLDENGKDVTERYKSSFLIESGNQSIVCVNEHGNAFKPDRLGSTTLTFTSMFNENLTVTVPINVVLYEPKSVHIAGNDYLYIYGDNKYTLRTEEGKTVPNKDITWTVEKGNASVNSNGVLTVSGLRTVTLKATITTSKGELHATRTLKVRFYSDFSQFVRKIAGHFAAFLALGVCSMTATILCTKYKKLSLLFALAYGFVIASLSEIFQLPIFTAGRNCSFIDVILDTMGVFAGCLITMMLFGLYMLLTKLFKPNKFRAMTFAIGNTRLGRLPKTKFNSFVQAKLGKQLQLQQAYRNKRKIALVESRQNDKN